MNEIKRQAIETMNELHRTIPYNDYCTVMSGLQDIETLQDRDEELEDLWRQFGDVPINPKNKKTEGCNHDERRFIEGIRSARFKPFKALR